MVGHLLTYLSTQPRPFHFTSPDRRLPGKKWSPPRSYRLSRWCGPILSSQMCPCEKNHPLDAKLMALGLFCLWPSAQWTKWSKCDRTHCLFIKAATKVNNIHQHCHCGRYMFRSSLNNLLFCFEIIRKYGIDEAWNRLTFCVHKVTYFLKLHHGIIYTTIFWMAFCS